MDQKWRWLAFLLVPVLLAGCAPAATPVAAGAAQAPVAEPPRTRGDTAVASAEVVPAQEARLSFALSGRVAAVTVAEGDVVAAGQVLVELETAAPEAGVAQAEAALEVAQAQLACLLDGPSVEEVAVARAQLAAAEAALTQALAFRGQLTAEACETQIAAARVELAAARMEEKSTRITYERVRNDETVTEWALEVWTLRMRAAERNLAAAEAGVVQAEKDVVRQQRAAQAAVETAAAQRDVARAELDLLVAAVGKEEIAAAEAGVSQAEAALCAAQAALDGAVLRAPAEGAVAALQVEPGQAVLPGQVLLVVADLGRLRVETTDLSERDVARVEPGQRATVLIEPLGVEIDGRVTGVAPEAITVGGDVVYRVVVGLDEQPAGLRWGMSAEVAVAVD